MSQLAVFALALGILAIAVKGRWLISTDAGMAQWMEAIRTPGRDAVASTITFFGSSPWALGVMAVMSLRWWFRSGLAAGDVSGARSAREHGAAMITVLWGTWLLGFTIQILLRFWVSQWRPDTVVVPAAADLFTRYDLAGFTSGHTFRSAFLYGWWAGWLARCHRSWATWTSLGCVALIVGVGFTRLYLNRHWLSDVIGAWILASLVLTAARWFIVTRRRQGVG